MKKLKKLLKILGPGFITGASDDDPSGIATYSQTGAQFGYSQLWTAFFSMPFMIVVQEMCGRIGLVTGKGLAGVVKQHYPKSILYGAVSLLLFANTVNIGADLGAMASSAQLLLDLPFPIWLIGMTMVTLFLEVFVKYNTYVKYLKFLALSLLAYVVVVLIIKQDWTKIFISTVIPTFSFQKDYILNIVAIFGTTISPYLFFWQADQVVEEEVAQGKVKTMGQGQPKITIRDMKNMRIDTIVGMAFSNLIMLFIIITAASTLNLNGIKNVETASQAAEALRPIAGNFTFLLFALGIVGTGLLAVPILAGSASYAVAETLGWRAGLHKKLRQAHGFYGVIAVATIVGLLINFTPIKPFTMLYYSAVLNGLCAPILLILIMLISNNKKILGTNTNGLFSNVLGWMITAFMSLTSLYLVWNMFHQ